MAEWPNLFVVGAPRAGTTSLWAYLGQNPDVLMARMKEPNFFTKMRPRRFPGVKDEREYLELFATGGTARYRGEASPNYLSDPATPARIKEASPNARILAILREPVARTYSDYWRRVRHGGERRAFLEVVRSELRSGPGPTSYVGRSLYAGQVERYLRVFGDAMHVTVFDDLVTDVRATVRKILEFLELDPSFAASFDAEPLNEFSLPRNSLVRRMYASRRLHRFGRRVVPSLLHRGVEHALLAAGPKPKLDAEARELLQSFFAPDQPRLESLLGRSLPW